MTTHHTEERILFGFWVYLMSDCVLFAGLFATYAVLNSATASGPIGGDFFQLPTVLLQTLLLLTSSFTYGLSLYAARLHKKTATVRALIITLLLGLSFLGLEVAEFRHLVLEGSGPSRSAFLSAFFTLVGTHGVHVLMGSLWMLLLIVQTAWYGTAYTMRRLSTLGLFWHFLDIVWIFIFTFVYLMGLL